MSRKDPQEKKALSYARDRRNTYGENDKGSRKSIRRNKRAPVGADRHREHQVLSGASGRVVPAEVAERVEVKLLAKKSMWLTKRWRKGADDPLAEVVLYKLRRRVLLGMGDPVVLEERIDRVRRHAPVPRHPTQS